jgi:hypothetical protein
MKSLMKIALAASAMTLTSPAAAQAISGQNGAPATTTAPRTLGTALGDQILVDGTPEEIASRQSLTPGGQIWQQGRPQTRISREQWRASGRPESQFDGILGNNRRMCVNTVVRILRYEDLARTFNALSGLDSPLANRYIALGGKIRQGAGGRQMAGVGQTLLGALTGFLSGGPVGALTYGGAVAAGAAGNEVQGQVHDEAMLLNRDAGVYNLVATVANIEANLLSAEGHIDYWEFITDNYCSRALQRTPSQ